MTHVGRRICINRKYPSLYIVLKGGRICSAKGYRQNCIKKYETKDMDITIYRDIKVGVKNGNTNKSDVDMK